MTPDQIAQERLDAIAVRLEPRLRRAFLAYVESMRPDELAPLIVRLQNGDVDGAVAWLTDRADVRAAADRIKATFAEDVIKVAALEASQVARVLTIQVAAPVASPSLIAAVRRWENGAFDRVQRETREGLRSVIADELARGIGPRQVAVALKRGIAGGGLTAYDTKIVGTFRAALEEGRYRDALSRTLRDLRSDRTLARLRDANGTLSPAQIDKMVAAYQRKLVAWRAETFARTAAIQAANEGASASWRAAVEQGAIPAAEVRRYWVVAQDERLCAVCEPMPGLNPNGVGLEDAFTTTTGTALLPPLHPNCRCVVFIRRERAGVRQRPAPGTEVLILPKLP